MLFDNHSLGKIGKEQRAGMFPEWQVSLVNPDFAAYATLCAMTALAYAATTSVADLLDLEHEEVVRRHANHLARAAMDDNETGGDGS